MSVLEAGQYYGQNKKSAKIGGLVISETYYPSNVSFPWHNHENPYFALVKQGLFTEKTKKSEAHCEKGMLLFHHSEDMHCNEVLVGGGSLHVEIDTDWFMQYNINLDVLRGVSEIKNPHLKFLFAELVKEFDRSDESSDMAIEGIMLQVLSWMKRTKMDQFIEKPSWIDQIKHYIQLHLSEKITLQTLSHSLNLHPLTISRTFEKYEHCKISDYIRKTRLITSRTMMSEGQYNLTEIALTCGFYDQSHFIKTFKTHFGVTPSTLIMN